MNPDQPSPPYKPTQPSPRNQWDTLLGVPKPACCNLRAACCSVATPSVAAKDLLAKAAEGDETSRDFLSVFLPHANHAAARAFYTEDPSHIDRVLALVGQQATRASLSPEDVVFFHCRYLGPDRRCQVYDDRPTFCRDYPASPMAILVKGCGYAAWQQTCRDKLRQLGYEVVGDDTTSVPG